MRSYRIVIEFTTRNPDIAHPDYWNWYDLVAENYGEETVSLVSVEDIATPEGHVEYFTEFDVELEEDEVA
jgi:hypothetical protein